MNCVYILIAQKIVSESHLLDDQLKNFLSYSGPDVLVLTHATSRNCLHSDVALTGLLIVASAVIDVFVPY